MYIPTLTLNGSETYLRSPSHAARDPEGSWPASILEKPFVAWESKGRTVALIAEPTAVQQMLGGSAEDFPKWDPIYRSSATQVVGRTSVLAAQGEQWERLRREFNPMFTPDKIDLMIRNSAAAIDNISAELSGRLDLFPLMNRAAVDVMWRTVIGDDIDCPSSSRLMQTSDEMTKAFNQHDLKGAAESLLAMTSRISVHTPGPAMDAACPFRALTRDGGPNRSSLTDQEVRENLTALIYAGQETTAMALVQTLWLLGQDQALQERLRQDVLAIPEEQLLTRAGISRLKHLACVLKEAMRLTSPGLITVRTNKKPFQVAGTVLPPDSILVVPLYALHRSKLLWEDPDSFRPERFAAGSPEPRHPMAFIPFSSGRHTCIAAKNSMFELQAALAHVLSGWRFRTIEPEKIEIYAHLIIRSDMPWEMEFEPL